MQGREKKLSKPNTQNKTNNIRNSFILKKKKINIWTLQLAIAINIISSKDAEKELVLHSRSDTVKFISYNANKVVEELFGSLSSRYQGNLETLVRRSDLLLMQFN